MAKIKEKLFSEFPPISTETWMAKITKDLKGVPFEKKLVWKTGEGFNVQPFYRREDIEDLKTTTSLPGEFPFVRGTKKNNIWKVRQEIRFKDPKAANEKALDILNKGITSLGFSAMGCELNATYIETLLAGINPETVELNFNVINEKAAELLELLTAYLKKHGADLSKCEGSINYDPFKEAMTSGMPNKEWEKDAIAVLEAAKPLPLFKVLNVNARRLNNAGAYITQELGYAIAWGNDLIAKLTDAGCSAEEIANRIKFNFGISTNYFMEIAKFRAARWLWAETVAAYLPEDADKEVCKMHALAETSKWNMTIYDAHVNLLRSQTETMSAAIAGVDSISVLPFNKMYEESDDFSERIARNQQFLLLEECHFDKVVDPSAGSYYIESLTKSLADVAWKLFLETEENKGFSAIVLNGKLQSLINQSNTTRHEAIARRKETLLGTNQFPNFTEKAAKKIKITPKQGKAPKGEIEALDFSRGASDFETMRLDLEKKEKTPKAFMVTMGNVVMRIARAQFACNFFGCTGYETIDNLGFKTVEEGIDAALKADADIIVLCSSDPEYAELAPAAYNYLNGRAEFVVAGMPDCMDDLKAMGIDQFVNVKSNVLETLKAFNKKLGID